MVVIVDVVLDDVEVAELSNNNCWTCKMSTYSSKLLFVEPLTKADELARDESGTTYQRVWMSLLFSLAVSKLKKGQALLSKCCEHKFIFVIHFLRIILKSTNQTLRNI